MRVLQLVAGEKWTGAAAVVFDQTAALVAAGVEAQFGFVRDSPLAARLGPLGWARPLLSRPRGPADYLRDRRVLRQTLERELFDVVHAHLSHDHFLAVAAARGLRVHVVRTFHHVDHVRRDPISRAIARQTGAFAFASRDVARKFGAQGPVHSPVVDTARFGPGKEPVDRMRALGIPQERFVVGTVGKLAAGRGHAEAIDAVAKLPEDSVLLHVGKGELRADLEARTARLGTAHRNFWAGYEEEGLPELYRAMDVLLFTASGSEQGQRAILEAMACAVPVVALDLPGVGDLVTHEREGLVAARPADLPGLLARLRESEAAREAMGRRGRERAGEFGAGSFARKAREFYARLAARKSTTSAAWEAGETLG